jgi:molybdenum cofactor biosynthesis enzyme MoaA
MYFAQDGSVRLCCHNMEYHLGKYPDQSIHEIWNSEAAQKVRQDMRAYRLYDGCNICRTDVEMGAYGEVRAQFFDSLPRHASYPTMMEFLLTNTCNLECIMCDGTYSSLIRQNREKLPPIPNVYDDAFIEQIREFIPHLREARFSGSGEAFLIDANYKIWEMIIELNPTCTIMVQTNGMVLNARVKDILSRGRFKIGVSIDSLDKETFETIRPNARLERVLETTRYFSEYALTKKMTFNIALCVMRQNWQELPAFVKLSNELNARTIFHKVYQPAEYSLQTLAPARLLEIITQLELTAPDAHTPLEKQNRSHFLYIIDSIREWHKAAVLDQFDHLSDDALLSGILQRAYQHIAETTDGSAEQDYRSFENKLAGLLQEYDDTGMKRKTLTMLYRADIGAMYPFFRQYPAEELFVLSQKYFESIA